MITHTSIVALFLLLRSIDAATQYIPALAWVSGKGDSTVYSWNYSQGGIVPETAAGGDYGGEGLAGLLVATDYQASAKAPYPYDILLISSNGTLYNISHFQSPVPTKYFGGSFGCDFSGTSITNYNGLLFTYWNYPSSPSIRIIDPKTGLNWNYVMPNKGPMGGNVCSRDGQLRYDVTNSTPNATGIGATYLVPTPQSPAAYIIDAQWTSTTPGALVLASLHNPTNGNIYPLTHPLGITITGSSFVAFTIADLWGNNTGWLVYGNNLYSVNLAIGGVGLNHTISYLSKYIGNNIAVLPVGYFPAVPKPTKMPTPIPIPSSYDIRTIVVVVLAIVVVVVLYRRTQRGRGGQRGHHRD